MKPANHSATPKVNFSAGLGSIKAFRSYQAHIMHALIPGQRDSENEVDALLPFPESRHCAFHLGGKSLAETFCTPFFMTFMKVLHVGPSWPTASSFLSPKERMRVTDLKKNEFEKLFPRKQASYCKPASHLLIRQKMDTGSILCVGLIKKVFNS